MALTERDFTREFCEQLVREHGSISEAAEAIAPQCICERYSNRAVEWRTVSRWISKHVGPRRLARDLSRVTDRADSSRVNRVAELLDRANVEAENAGTPERVKLSSWGYAMKVRNADGSETPTEGGLYKTEITLRPGLEAPDIIPRSSPIRAYKATGVRNADCERIAIVGDIQIGFWAVLDPEDPKRITFEPFHDEAAIDVMMQAFALYQPDRVVIVGDFLDFPQLSRFQQEPQWAQTLQASIQEGYDLIGKIRKTVGDACTIDFVPGNHETRMQRAVVNGNPALYNLKRPGEKYSLYSMPSLLGFEKHVVECAAEYPSGEVWLASRRGNIPALVVTHGNPSKKEMRADTIHGHLVLPAIETRQVFYEDGPVTYTRMCVSGCGNYSDTGDKVRLTRTNTPSGRSRMSAVPSFGTVDIDRATGLRHYGLHLINNGAVQFRDKILTSTIQERSSGEQAA